MSENTQDIESTIEDVTVFLNGAQIHRTTQVDIPAGTTELVFKGLSAKANMESLFLSCEQDIKILDVKHSIYQNKPVDGLALLDPEDKKEIESLQQAIETLNMEIALIQEEHIILDKEKAFIRDIRLTQNTVEEKESVSELEEKLDFYKKKYVVISKRFLELEQEKKQLNKEKGEKQQAINTIHEKNNKKNNLRPQNEQFTQVEVLVSADKALKADFELSYLVRDAYWRPAYDIRTEGIDKPLEVTHKSNVCQNTGIEWKDIKLTVSTSNPYQDNNRPILSPWYLNFYHPQVHRGNIGGDNQMMNSYAAPSKLSTEVDEIIEEEPYFDRTFVQTIDTDLNLAFELNWRYSIPSDAENHTIVLKEENVEAEYVHHAVPKLDCKSYLIAKVKDWGRLNLLEGEANLFAGGTYIGKTHINPKKISEYLLLSLGVDEKVNVKRQKLQTNASTSFFGSTKTQVFTYEITLRNNKSKAITMELLDQIPISNTGEIEVVLLNSGKSTYDEKIGKLLWDIKLEPNEIKKVQFKYSLEYPKDKQIGGL